MAPVGADMLLALGTVGCLNKLCMVNLEMASDLLVSLEIILKTAKRTLLIKPTLILTRGRRKQRIEMCEGERSCRARKALREEGLKMQ